MFASEINLFHIRYVVKASVSKHNRDIRRICKQIVKWPQAVFSESGHQLESLYIADE